MKNTRIDYLYRDGANWKQHNECVVAGVIDETGVAAIVASLDEDKYFIPRAVGLPETRFPTWNEDDHSYFELDAAGFGPTDEEPTVDVDAETLVARFKAAAGHWKDFESDGPGMTPGPVGIPGNTEAATHTDTVDEGRAMQYLYEKFNLSGEAQRICAAVLHYWNAHPEVRPVGIVSYLTELLDPIGFGTFDVDAMRAAGIL